MPLRGETNEFENRVLRHQNSYKESAFNESQICVYECLANNSKLAPANSKAGVSSSSEDVNWSIKKHINTIISEPVHVGRFS